MKTPICQAIEAIANSDHILIGAGAGMGVDSGLPDFRGNEGFWKAYPPLAKLGIPFQEMANPKWFASNPELAWGFYGHRLNLYRATMPHAGFQVLLELCQRRSHFVFTSNVDGHFQKAGFNSQRVFEYHGSIHHLQCRTPHCPRRLNEVVWSADDMVVNVDETTFRAEPPLPICPECSNVARPNILMFRDNVFQETRFREQQKRYFDWANNLEGKSVVIECGAGTAIPSVRILSEQFAKEHGALLVRINMREALGPLGTISISGGALESLEAIWDGLAVS